MKRKKAPLLGIFIVLLANAATLIGVAWNRRGGPVETFELTERELPLQWVDAENSGVVLRLNWASYRRNTGSGTDSLAAPFDEGKLKELGFRCPPLGSSGPGDVKLSLPREMFVALEYDGDSWGKWFQMAKNLPENDRSPGASTDWAMATRLFAVDASPSFAVLRTRYPRRDRFLIVRGVVRAMIQGSRAAGYSWRGTVSEILPSEICVSPPFSKSLSAIGSKTDAKPRYSITLHYGRSLQPWIAGVSLQSEAR
jgi:hypothetical protein